MPTHAAIDGIDILVILLYLFATAYLGWLGWKGTRSASDFLLAGRGAHPVIMAISYGATFISTSAIVGFGGVASASISSAMLESLILPAPPAALFTAAPPLLPAPDPRGSPKGPKRGDRGSK